MNINHIDWQGMKDRYGFSENIIKAIQECCCTQSCDPECIKNLIKLYLDIQLAYIFNEINLYKQEEDVLENLRQEKNDSERKKIALQLNDIKNQKQYLQNMKNIDIMNQAIAEYKKSFTLEP